MRLYRVIAGQEGSRGLPDFLNSHYVSCGLPGLGDLGLVGRSELQAKLRQAHGLDGRELERRLEEHWNFAHALEDGDYVVAGDGERLYLGDLGDYYYLEEFDNAEERSGHRRGVTWLRRLERGQLHPELAAFLGEDGETGLFGRSVAREELERLLSPPSAAEGAPLVDEATLREALDVLKAALRSDDPERRERAAAAIVRAATLRV
ncbi:hypothetical protein I8J29_18800 [Paenibacillus sp. MWE-103]|uniref:HEAT repeat protein n=1 Tax=Paenibacillus artemisiicola TaxID=1172618 RepID=A0ABS3WDB1_9BACL|nr:hypothetical protein [Paenibacillus artemisiicola]MBO7746262.1 hypothetical protein [Paenibacillus artemisiicola]